jgi:hypothetical protein
MPFASVDLRGTASNKSSGTTISLTPTATIPVGALVVVEVAADNVGTSNAADTTEHGIASSPGQTWTKLREMSRGAGSAAAGVVTSLWATVVTTALTTSDSITLTISSARTAKVIAARAFTFSNFWSANLSGVVTGTPTHGNSASPSVSTSSLSSGTWLLLGVVGRERPDGDTHGSVTDWTMRTKRGTTGSTAATNVSFVRGDRVLNPGSGVQTFNPTIGTSGDWSAIIAAIPLVYTPPPDIEVVLWDVGLVLAEEEPVSAEVELATEHLLSAEAVDAFPGEVLGTGLGLGTAHTEHLTELAALEALTAESLSPAEGTDVIHSELLEQVSQALTVSTEHRGAEVEPTSPDIEVVLWDVGIVLAEPEAVSGSTDVSTEHLTPAARESLAPTEVLSQAAAQELLAAEVVQGALETTPLPTEHLSPVQADAALGGEIVGGVVAAGSVATEFLSQVAGQDTFPAESLERVAGLETVPTELLEQVSQAAALSTEHRGPELEPPPPPDIEVVLWSVGIVLEEEEGDPVSIETTVSTEHVGTAGVLAVVVTETLAGQTPTEVDLTSEHLVGLRAERVLAAESLGPAAGAVAAQVEVQTEHLGSPRSDRTVSAELVAPAARLAPLATETLGSALTLLQAPTEHLVALEVDEVLSTEILGPSAGAVAAQAVFTTEHLGAVRRDGVIFSELRAPIVRLLVIGTETLVRATAGLEASSEHLGAPRGAKAIHTELLGGAISDQVLSSEHTLPVSAELPLPGEHLVQVSAEEGMEGEVLQVEVVETTLFTEVLGPQALPVARDMVLPTEFLTGRPIASPIASEHLTGAITRTAALPSEHLERDILEVIFWTEVEPGTPTFAVEASRALLTEHLRRVARNRVLPTVVWGPLPVPVSGILRMTIFRRETTYSPTVSRLALPWILHPGEHRLMSIDLVDLLGGDTIAQVLSVEVMLRTTRLSGQVLRTEAPTFTSFAPAISGTSVSAWVRVPTDTAGDHELRVAVLTGDGRTVSRTQRFRVITGTVDLFPIWRIQAGDEVPVALGFAEELGGDALVSLLSVQLVRRIETATGAVARVPASGFGGLDAAISPELGDGWVSAWLRPGADVTGTFSLRILASTSGGERLARVQRIQAVAGVEGGS